MSFDVAALGAVYLGTTVAPSALGVSVTPTSALGMRERAAALRAEADKLDARAAAIEAEEAELRAAHEAAAERERQFWRQRFIASHGCTPEEWRARRDAEATARAAATKPRTVEERLAALEAREGGAS